MLNGILMTKLYETKKKKNPVIMAITSSLVSTGCFLSDYISYLAEICLSINSMLVLQQYF